DPKELGAGDQGMMFGFAVRETPDLMPLPITLAHNVARELARARKSGALPYLRPDGKSQVTVEYSRGVPRRVHTVVVAAQHDPGIEYQRLCNDIRERVVRPAIGDAWLDERTTYLVNGTGAFTIGGPMGDAGLTGRKIIVDTYGGVRSLRPHGISVGAHGPRRKIREGRRGKDSARLAPRMVGGLALVLHHC